MPRKLVCECGACPKCRHRERMRLRYQTKVGEAEKVRQRTKRYREANLERIREEDRNRGFRGTRGKFYNDSRGIPKQPCEVCGSTEDVQKHHDDYTKPRDVRWLCRTHHMALHRRF